MSSSMLLHTPSGGQLCIDHFNVQSYNELEETRKEAWKNIDSIKEKMKMMAVSNPKDYVTEGSNMLNAISEISADVDEYWSWLEDEIMTLMKCRVVDEMVWEWEYGEFSPSDWDVNKREDWLKMAPDMYAEEREAWKETLAQFKDCPKEIKDSIMTEDVVNE